MLTRAAARLQSLYRARGVRSGWPSLPAPNAGAGPDPRKAEHDPQTAQTPGHREG